MEKRSKKQHYVPRFYLERFVNPNGMISTYDKALDRAFLSPPTETAAEINFYSYQNEDGTWNDELEKQLSKIESEASKIFPELIEGKPLSGTIRTILANFIAVQYLRSPVMVVAHADMMGKMVHNILARTHNDPDGFSASMDEFDRENGTRTSEYDRQKIREFVQDTSKYEINVLKKIGVQGLIGAENLAAILEKTTWLVSEVEGQHLIASDSPVVKVYDPKSYHPAYGDGGFSNKTMYVTFPLNAQRILSMGWWNVQEGGVHKERKQRGRLYNRQRAMNAERYLYSSTEDAGISQLGRKFADRDYRPRILIDGDMPKIHLKRKLK